jgi:hypothetical protein
MNAFTGISFDLRCPIFKECPHLTARQPPKDLLYPIQSSINIPPFARLTYCSSQKRYGDSVQLTLTRNRPDHQRRSEASTNKVHYKSASCRGKCYPSLFIIDHHDSLSTAEGPESCQNLANLPPHYGRPDRKRLTKYKRLCKVRITKYPIHESRFLSQSSGKGGREAGTTGSAERRTKIHRKD